MFASSRSRLSIFVMFFSLAATACDDVEEPKGTDAGADATLGDATVDADVDATTGTPVDAALVDAAVDASTTGSVDAGAEYDGSYDGGTGYDGGSGYDGGTGYDGGAGSDGGTGSADASVPGFAATVPLVYPTESGGTATFSVALATAPTAAVAFTVRSSDTTEGTVFPNGLVFTPSNWSVPQVVTLTGVDDDILDGAVRWTALLGVAVSNDIMYAGLDPEDVNTYTIDDEMAGYAVSAPSHALCEGVGSVTSFQVHLTARPGNDVVFPVTAPATVSLSPTSLTFSPSNWATDQTVTVSARASLVSGPTVIALGAPSTYDPWYGVTDPQDVVIDVCDVGDAAFVITDAVGMPLAGPLTTDEDGLATSFAVQLSRVPSGPVTVAVSATDVDEVAIAPASLVFDASNWNVPQVVTLTGLLDTVSDSPATFSIVLDGSSSDAPFDGMPPTRLDAVNLGHRADLARNRPVTVACSNLCFTQPTDSPFLVDGLATSNFLMLGAGTVTATIDLTRPAALPGTTVTATCGPATITSPINLTVTVPKLMVSSNGTTFTEVAYTPGVPVAMTTAIRYVRLEGTNGFSCSELAVNEYVP